MSAETTPIQESPPPRDPIVERGGEIALICGEVMIVEGGRADYDPTMVTRATHRGIVVDVITRSDTRRWGEANGVDYMDCRGLLWAELLPHKYFLDIPGMEQYYADRLTPAKGILASHADGLLDLIATSGQVSPNVVDTFGRFVAELYAEPSG